MREVDIRRGLREQIRQEHIAEPNTVIVEELGLCQGTARIDMAAVNGNLHGYEIKSAQDTLTRLPIQTAIYSEILDFVTVVVAPTHGRKAAAVVPEWWGILQAVERRQAVAFTPVRVGTRNPRVNPASVAQLLWRDEALAELETRGLAAGFRSKPRAALWERLSIAVSEEELRGIVRSRLKKRPPAWRVTAPPT